MLITDTQGGHVRGSLQCPAQSFYDDLPGYFERFKDSKKIIFYCQSSNGRGPRCAGWWCYPYIEAKQSVDTWYRYQDHLDSVGYTSSKAYIMAGGIREWMGKFQGEEDLVEYDWGRLVSNQIWDVHCRIHSITNWFCGILDWGIWVDVDIWSSPLVFWFRAWTCGISRINI